MLQGAVHLSPVDYSVGEVVGEEVPVFQHLDEKARVQRNIRAQNEFRRFALDHPFRSGFNREHRNADLLNGLGRVPSARCGFHSVLFMDGNHRFGFVIVHLQIDRLRFTRDISCTRLDHNCQQSVALSHVIVYRINDPVPRQSTCGNDPNRLTTVILTKKVRALLFHHFQIHPQVRIGHCRGSQSDPCGLTFGDRIVIRQRNRHRWEGFCRFRFGGLVRRRRFIVYLNRGGNLTGCNRNADSGVIVRNADIGGGNFTQPVGVGGNDANTDRAILFPDLIVHSLHAPINCRCIRRNGHDPDQPLVDEVPIGQPVIVHRQDPDPQIAPDRFGGHHIDTDGIALFNPLVRKKFNADHRSAGNRMPWRIVFGGVVVPHMDGQFARFSHFIALSGKQSNLNLPIEFRIRVILGVNHQFRRVTASRECMVEWNLPNVVTTKLLHEQIQEKVILKFERCDNPDPDRFALHHGFILVIHQRHCRQCRVEIRNREREFTILRGHHIFLAQLHSDRNLPVLLAPRDNHRFNQIRIGPGFTGWNVNLNLFGQKSIRPKVDYGQGYVNVLVQGQ